MRSTVVTWLKRQRRRCIFEVDQLFRELIEVPVMGWIAVDLGPGAYRLSHST